MFNIHKKFGFFTVLLLFTVSATGCTVIFQKGRRVDVEKISKLRTELTELERAKAELEEKLSTEIGDREVKIEMLEKGLVITFVAEVLFDSGKADLRQPSLAKLKKVSKVLNKVVPDFNISIEGHTDNVPIKYSSWKSNWELSSARALSVLNFLVTSKVNPELLSATGYGEYRPVSTNDTKVGRQRNRRVEIVVVPEVQRQVKE